MAHPSSIGMPLYSLKPTLMVAAFLLLGVGVCASQELQGDSAWPDEPDELSWEHAATCRECFDDFMRWVSAQPDRIPASAMATSELPDAFASVWIPAEAFVVETSRWSLEPEQALTTRKTGTGHVLQGAYGHHAEPTRVLVPVLRTGWYRLWVRSFHLQGYHATFRVRLTPKEVMQYTMPWQTNAQGEYLNQRFDNAEFGRRQPLISRKDEPTGFHWEGSRLVHLNAGTVTLEVSGCIHEGPYTTRRIDCLVLTADPLLRPTDESTVGAIVGTEVSVVQNRPSAATARHWGPWTCRPGSHAPGQGASEALMDLWRSWRDDLISRLAAGDTTSMHQQRLSRMVYFDPAWNLIGTPAQVREEVQRLGRERPGPDTWFRTLEAEDMQDKTPGWETEASSVSGAGSRLTASYLDGLAERVTTTVVPQAGRVFLWVRHSRIQGYANLFHVQLRTLEQDSVAEPMRLDFGEEPAADGGYHMRWTRKTFDLPNGRLEVILAKNVGKGPYAYRHVDRLILTNSADWVPEGTGDPPLTGQQISNWKGTRRGENASSLVVWRQANPWLGFQMNAAHPGPEDECFPDSITFDPIPGEVSSALIHVTNADTHPQTVTPRILGAGRGAFRWRLVAYVLSKPHGWQPMPLLERRTVTVPPLSSASLWLTADSRLETDACEAILDLGGTSIDLRLRPDRDHTRSPRVPLVGGFCAPYPSASSWQLFADIGINVIHGVMIPKTDMQRLGIRLMNVTLGMPDTPRKIADIVAATRAMGLDTSDWSWEIFDEPGDTSADEWAAAAGELKRANNDIRVWCNPGDANVCQTPALRAMVPHVDIFCPYINHLTGQADPDHAAFAAGAGSTRLLYTTPCADEKAPNAPLDLLALAEYAHNYERDGWDFFCLKNYYEYCNSPWDDVEAFHPDQAVSVYPGAWQRTISTRNLEAVREAIQGWRRKDSLKEPSPARP